MQKMGGDFCFCKMSFYCLFGSLCLSCSNESNETFQLGTWYLLLLLLLLCWLDWFDGVLCLLVMNIVIAAGSQLSTFLLK